MTTFVFCHYFCSFLKTFTLSARNATQQIQPAEGSSLFARDAAQSQGCLQKLLNYADSVSNWISAEIVMCDSVKVRGHISHENSEVT